MQDNEASNELLASQHPFDDSYDWKEQQNEKARFKNPRIKDLYPINFNNERDRFFQLNCEYNPHFCYQTVVSPELLPLSTQFDELAHKILTNNKFEQPQLPVLGESEVLETVEKYLEQLGLNEYVEIKLETNILSRTTVGFFKDKAVLKLRTPLEYNRVSLEGVLHHEVGTHILRRLNHKENCVRKPSEEGKLIEEGLAAINQLLPQDKPFLFKAALRYVAAVFASKMSFSQVYKQLNKYLKDHNDCWRECVRVKRGLGNTEEFGGYYKDQTYLVGAVELLRNRKSIDFRRLFYAKLSPAETAKLTGGVLPPFLQTEEKLKHYLKKLDVMALYNFID